ncbi:uncharacterized protein LOC142344002 [Convolutriloba macropyga]|uniref:uncharacterized protein LOC142344002 n=1 Tax=Convolutriloba macropyga TaxID=536237 RepID=UPI003F51E0E1
MLLLCCYSLLLFVNSRDVFAEFDTTEDYTRFDTDNMPKIREFFGELGQMDSETFSTMMLDLIRTLIETCVANTEYSYWVCNDVDMYGTLLNPDGYVFANQTQFPDRDIEVASTKEGAYIQSLLGAFLTQKLHFYRLRYQNVCHVDGPIVPAEDQVALHGCVKDDITKVSEMFRVFLRKYKKANPKTADLLQHNLVAGHKLFLEILEDPNETPCLCVVNDKCPSLTLSCYNHNIHRDLYADVGSRLHHWTQDAKLAIPDESIRKRLYTKNPSSDKPERIGYKKLAYMKDYERQCKTVEARKCVRSKSYEICNLQFTDKTEWYQRYLKKSCSHLCSECSLGVIDATREYVNSTPHSHTHWCPGGTPAKYFKCSSDGDMRPVVERLRRNSWPTD